LVFRAAAGGTLCSSVYRRQRPDSNWVDYLGPEASGSVAGTLSAGSGVHANETVKTGSSGKAGLQFNDQSNLSVGPSSQVRLDKFVYDPNKETGSTVIEATRGTFRFTTAQNRGELKIKTLYGTLGTRG